MKNKPAKLLMALLLGLGCTTFVSTAAFATDSDNKAKHDKDEKDKSDKAAASVTGTTSSLVTACGISFIQTTHTSTVSTSTKDEEKDDDTHKSKDKDAKNKNDYDYAEAGHKDHLDRSTGSNKEGDGKISICHRMGGAEVTITVANDGWLNGHSKHALDTIGRCSDFDDKVKSAHDDSSPTKDSDAKDRKVTASDAGYSAGLTVTQIACLKGDPGTTYTGFDGQGNPFTSPGAGLNNTTDTISIQPPNQKPSRGGARTLH